MDHLFRNATEEQMLEASQTLSANHYTFRIVFLSEIDDIVYGFTLHQVKFGLSFRPERQALRAVHEAILLRALLDLDQAEQAAAGAHVVQEVQQRELGRLGAAEGGGNGEDDAREQGEDDPHGGETLRRERRQGKAIVGGAVSEGRKGRFCGRGALTPRDIAFASAKPRGGVHDH